MSKRYAVVLSVVLLSITGVGRLDALPRFSLLSGTRCSACHFVPQGGGMRNELGWSTMNEVGALHYDEIGMDALAAESNLYLDGLLAFGLDARLQIARLGRPSVAEPQVPRRVIPMQIQPYMAIMPVEWLTAYGGYNFSTTKFSYAGQTSWDAALHIQPDITAPSLLLGMIQPSIGVRHDDHTMFVRRDVAGTGAPIIPPGYNEFGAEVIYEGQHLLTANAGVYLAKNLAQIDPTVDSTKPSFLVRAQLWPQLLDEGINGQLGASYMMNGDFRMINVFGGIGLADQATLFSEVMMTRNALDREITNVMIQASYQFFPWLALEGRYEWGTTKTATTSAKAHSFVIGTQFFPIPYLELRPEYRYIETDTYILAQYALQLHLFY